MAVFTQTTTFANGATADGGQVNTEIVNLGTSVNNIVNAQIASAAAIAISKTALGTYTAPTAWTPTFTGFSVSPTGVGTYSQIGRMVFVTWETTVAGTSDATGFAITNLPVTPTVTSFITTSVVFNNGGSLPDPGLMVITASTATVQIYKDTSQTLWTASSTKYVNFSIWYFA